MNTQCELPSTVNPPSSYNVSLSILCCFCLGEVEKTENEAFYVEGRLHWLYIGAYKCVVEMKTLIHLRDNKPEKNIY